VGWRALRWKKKSKDRIHAEEAGIQPGRGVSLAELGVSNAYWTAGATQSEAKERKPSRFLPQRTRDSKIAKTRDRKIKIAEK